MCIHLAMVRQAADIADLQLVGLLLVDDARESSHLAQTTIMYSDPGIDAFLGMTIMTLAARSRLDILVDYLTLCIRYLLFR